VTPPNDKSKKKRIMLLHRSHKKYYLKQVWQYYCLQIQTYSTHNHDNESILKIITFVSSVKQKQH